MARKKWRVVKPRKHASEATMFVECEQCRAKINREKDASVKTPQGKHYCLHCADEAIDDAIDDAENVLSTLKRLKTKLFVTREGGGG